MKENSGLYYTIAGLCFIIIGLAIAYSTLQTSITINSGNVGTGTLSWNVGIDTTNSTITATTGGTSDTGRSCSNATVTSTSITTGDITLSKPDDSCTYQFTVKNLGSVDAALSSIAANNATSCTVATGNNSITCGNITYLLSTNSNGTSLYAAGASLSKTTGSQTLYLIVKYNSSEVSTTAESHANVGFTMNWVQN